MIETMNIDLDKFSSDEPTEEGIYLAYYVNFDKSVLASISLLTIGKVSEKNHGGLIFPERLGIVEQGGRHPANINAKWLKLGVSQ